MAGMRLGLLPGALSSSGGPGTYVTGVTRSLLDVDPDIDVSALFLGVRHTMHARDLRRSLSSTLGHPGRVSVRSRPVSMRAHASAARRLIPSYDALFGRHDVYHQTHLDVDPRVPGRKLVLTLHDLIARRWPDEGQVIEGAEALLSRAAGVITVSDSSRWTILGAFPSIEPSRVHVVWNGVDHSTFHGDAAPEDGSHLSRLGVSGTYLLYVGGLTRRKNVDVLVAAHHRLREQQDDVPPLVLVGPWRSTQLPGQGPGVRALGAVPAAAVPALMRRASLVVLPSRDEGFGLPLLEAQACGALVACSDIPVFREVGGDAPFYVDSTAPAALAEGVAAALRASRQEAAHRRDRGILHARGFSWERSARDHVRVYRKVAEGVLADTAPH